MVNALIIAVYLACATGAYALNDAGYPDAAWTIIATGALITAPFAGRMWFLVVPVLAVVFSIPFGYVDEFDGSDAPHALVFAALSAIASVAIAGAAILARWAFERWVTEPPG